MEQSRKRAKEKDEMHMKKYTCVSLRKRSHLGNNTL